MNFFSWSFFATTLFRIVGRVPVTLGITAGAFSAGMALAFILAAVQLYKVPVAWQAARFYISFIRGTPILIQLLICDPIKKAGDSNTYFQPTMFANGTTIVEQNWYGLVTK